MSVWYFLFVQRSDDDDDDDDDGDNFWSVAL